MSKSEHNRDGGPWESKERRPLFYNNWSILAENCNLWCRSNCHWQIQSGSTDSIASWSGFPREKNPLRLDLVLTASQHDAYLGAPHLLHTCITSDSLLNLWSHAFEQESELMLCNQVGFRRIGRTGIGKTIFWIVACFHPDPCKWYVSKSSRVWLFIPLNWGGRLWRWSSVWTGSLTEGDCKN